MTAWYIIGAILVAFIWLVTWAACRAAALSDRAAEEALRKNRFPSPYHAYKPEEDYDEPVGQSRTRPRLAAKRTARRRSAR
jgi:hypothetical protein